MGPKVALITGAARHVGFTAGVALAKRLPEGSKVFLTARSKDIDKLNNNLEDQLDPTIQNSIKFMHLDFEDKKSVNKLWLAIKNETNYLDILVNNSQKYHLPSLMNDDKFRKQTEHTINVNYFGLKKMCKIFSPMMSQGGRIVNCSSHLGHLSNIDGREPQATKLRVKLADKRLEERELDELVMEFQELTSKGSGRWYQSGWPSCPYTVTKVAVNAYTRILQNRFDTFTPQRDLVVNSVHHGGMHRMMNTTGGFSDVQAGDLVAGLALLPAHTVIRGKVIWRDVMMFDNWQHGGLDDNNKLEKVFVASYDVEDEFYKNQYEVNNGFCMDG